MSHSQVFLVSNSLGIDTWDSFYTPESRFGNPTKFSIVRCQVNNVIGNMKNQQATTAVSSLINLVTD